MSSLSEGPRLKGVMGQVRRRGAQGGKAGLVTKLVCVHVYHRPFLSSCCFFVNMQPKACLKSSLCSFCLVKLFKGNIIALIA